MAVDNPQRRLLMQQVAGLAVGSLLPSEPALAPIDSSPTIEILPRRLYHNLGESTIIGFENNFLHAIMGNGQEIRIGGLPRAELRLLRELKEKRLGEYVFIQFGLTTEPQPLLIPGTTTIATVENNILYGHAAVPFFTSDDSIASQMYTHLPPNDYANSRPQYIWTYEDINNLNSLNDGQGFRFQQQPEDDEYSIYTAVLVNGAHVERVINNEMCYLYTQHGDPVFIPASDTYGMPQTTIAGIAKQGFAQFTPMQSYQVGDLGMHTVAELTYVQRLG